MKNRNILIFILIGMISFILIFVSTRREHLEDYTSESNPMIELSFMSSWAGVDKKSSFLDLVIEEFEKENPNIRIINESMYGEDFLFALKVGFASGNGPDIFGLWPGSDLELLIENQLLADLSSTLNSDREWVNNLSGNAQNHIDLEKEVYSIPFEFIYEGLYINIDLFEKYAVKIPENFDELLLAIKIFNEEGIVPIAYNSTPEGSFIYQNIVAQISKKQDVVTPYNDDGSIKSGFIKGMEIMKILYEANAFPHNAFTLDDDSRNQLFIEKKAAMIVQGSWFNDKENEESISIIPFPIELERGVTVIVGVGNGNFHISEKAFNDPDKKAAAISFLKFLTSEKGKSIFSASPAFYNENQLEYTSTLSNQGANLIRNADVLVEPPDHFINRIFWESVLIKEFPNMLEGKITAEEIFEQIHDY